MIIWGPLFTVDMYKYDYKIYYQLNFTKYDLKANYDKKW